MSKPLSVPQKSGARTEGGVRRGKLLDFCEPVRIVVVPGSAEATRRPYLGLEDVESQSGRILGTDDSDDVGKSMSFAFGPHDVLYGKLRPYLNKVALPDFEGRCTTELIPLRPRAGVDRDFLAWLLRRPETVAAAMQQKTGSRMPRADMDTLMSMEVDVPPENEQRRIAARLGAQCAIIARARVAAALRLRAASLLASAELREGFSEDRTRPWRRKKVGAIAEVVGGIQKSPDRTASRFSRPYLTVRNVQHGRLDLTKVEEFEITPRELERLRLQSGDLLIVEGNGSLDHIGRNALFDQPGEWIHQNHVIRVRLDRSQALPEFASLYFHSPLGREQMIDRAKTTSGLYTLSTGKVQSLDLPLPNITQQRRVVSALRGALARAETLTQLIQDELDSLNRMPDALLRAAFNGDT